ncbi:hypothetical protein [Pseudoalteromonas ardens]|uniref:Uncharacterized protein n=1 Tax=Pseudoalteromonas rubra TaxID=43658 RepID=A0A0L0ETC7_9GAMM|nr:hypothetical protein [Pseudoalteromonas sp. R96]KNC67620.1 hypothetical protein AC626_09530 [Pseudoalteromonas rubra]MDK1310798.1 hypothetical protein [Pseudoalteromonas sp. R96]
MDYKHTQIGTAILAVMGTSALVLAYSAIVKPEDNANFAFLVVGVIAILFSSLTIKIGEGQIRWFFGPGFWRKSLDYTQIDSAKIIKTKWYNGLGIRLLSTGWLYNVSGLDAVELKLKDGTTVSLGTNEPEKLLEAIKKALES